MAEFYLRTADHLPGLLAAFRKQSGLTQAELAYRLGITQQALSKLERNAETMSIGRLLKLMSVLNVELVLRDGDNRPLASPPDGGW